MGSRRSDDGDTAQQAIGEMVQRLVLPKMVQTHRELGLRPRLMCDLEAFIEKLLQNQLEPVLDSIQAMRHEGHPLEVIYSELLTPAARLLGEKWLRDAIGFSDVTLATWQLEQILHHFHQDFEGARQTRTGKASVLISLMPGDQHSLGAKMLSAFFRKDHWDVNLLQPQSLQAAFQRIVALRPQLIAITVTQTESLEQVRDLLKMVRQQSELRSTPWMIGGRVINEQPMQAVAVLSDRNIHLCQGDAKQALVLANRLLNIGQSAQRHHIQSSPLRSMQPSA
ncbi:MAG: cobalamin B12-binding domain-containing protein [Betaproteobacteria bacterium]|nr:cobalamin B12-binding domain-containing protein [Betaproteobacteria bacterium]NCV89291.1 cobalamin B12-binding domain-containing protein [Betaproteobacteria bacterium]NDA30828.1 cobalamin B12-binding domain-containing protein [Betaproteobacteria bacterium]NDF77106.1 cobalamin B12-binding domain-containing protein [Betaproteobacteria bacterium]